MLFQLTCRLFASGVKTSPLLVQKFIEHFCETHKLDLKTVSPQVMKALMAYDWPGNVRQLENIVERMVALTGKRTAILPADLPGEIQNRDSLNFVPLIEIPEEGINFQNVVTDMERGTDSSKPAQDEREQETRLRKASQLETDDADRKD
jgi:DNA-binding NtrC family response regulator